MKKVFAATALTVLAVAFGIKFFAAHPTSTPETGAGSASGSNPPPAAPPSSAATPPMGASTTPPATPAPHLSVAEFNRKAEAVLAELPTNEEIHNLPEEAVHRTPKPLIAAGAEVGEIAEAVEKNPELAPQGLAFYGKCARKAELATSARALCLASMRELAAQTGTTPDESGIDPDIAHLANRLAQ